MSEQASDFPVTRMVETRWQTFLQARVAAFREALASEPKAGDFASEAHLKLLSERNDKYQLANIKLSTLGLLLLLCLFVTRYYADIEIQFFGLSAKSIGKLKELLLFVVSVLGFVTSTLSYVCTYRSALIKELMIFRFPSTLKGYLSLAYSDEDAAGMFSADTMFRAHWVRGAAVLLFAAPILFLLFLAAFVVGVTYLQISIVAQVIESPSLPLHLTYFVAGFSGCVTIYSIVVLAACWLPFPHKDYSGLKKLRELQESNAEKYNAVMRRLSLEDEQREDRFLHAYSLVAFAIWYTASTALVDGWSSLQSLSFFIRLMLVAPVMMVVLARILIAFRRTSRARMFAHRPEAREDQLKRYSVFKRSQRTFRIVSPLIFTVALQLFTHTIPHVLDVAYRWLEQLFG